MGSCRPCLLVLLLAGGRLPRDNILSMLTRETHHCGTSLEPHVVDQEGGVGGGGGGGGKGGGGVVRKRVTCEA